MESPALRRVPLRPSTNADSGRLATSHFFALESVGEVLPQGVSGIPATATGTHGACSRLTTISSSSTSSLWPPSVWRSEVPRGRGAGMPPPMSWEYFLRCALLTNLLWFLFGPHFFPDVYKPRPMKFFDLFILGHLQSLNPMSVMFQGRHQVGTRTNTRFFVQSYTSTHSGVKSGATQKIKLIGICARLFKPTTIM